MLLGRQYIIERCQYSDIFVGGPSEVLRTLLHYFAVLDQCRCGGTLHVERIRKRSMVQSNLGLKHLNLKCF